MDVFPEPDTGGQQFQQDAGSEQNRTLYDIAVGRYDTDNDGEVPESICIYFLKPHLQNTIFILVLMLAVVAWGVYSLMPADDYMLVACGVLIMLLGLFKLGLVIRELILHKPQLILDNKGIKTVAAGFCPWAEITDEKVILLPHGRRSSWFLSFGHRNGLAELNIENLDTSLLELRRYLRVYRSRSVND